MLCKCIKELNTLLFVTMLTVGQVEFQSYNFLLAVSRLSYCPMDLQNWKTSTLNEFLKT